MASSVCPVSLIAFLGGGGFVGLDIILATNGSALLPRDALRNWACAPDVDEAVVLVLRASELCHAFYNLTGASRRSSLRGGQTAASGLGNGLRCALAGDAAANIDLHAAADRPSSERSRPAAEFGWPARHGLAESASRFIHWWLKKGTSRVRTA